MVEDLIYADTLTSAVDSDSTLEELAYVAAFACSVYAQTSSSARMTKPFNPMLGETFECDRRAESGWRCLLEQVQYCLIHGATIIHVHVRIQGCIHTHVHAYYTRVW